MVRTRVSIDQEEMIGEFLFEDVMKRLMSEHIVCNQSELASLLKLKRASVSYVATQRKYVPREWKARFERAGISWEWVTTGVGDKYTDQHVMVTGTVVNIPRMKGLEGNKIVVDNKHTSFVMHKTTLADDNISSRNLVYLKQVGDSMAPLIQSGDIVILDPDSRDIYPECNYLMKIGSEVLPVIRTIINVDGVNNTIIVGYKNNNIGNQVFSIDSVSIIARCIRRYGRC